MTLFTRIASALVSMTGAALFFGQAHAAENTYDRPALEIGGFLGDDGGSGEVNVIAPLMFSEGKDLLFFGADAKFSGFDFNNASNTVYNLGGYLGYRRLLDDNQGVLGMWAGVDYFNTTQDNEFARAIAGVEFFGEHVIARANGFVPFDNTSKEWTVTSGGIVNTYDEKVPSGFDVELGLRMAVPMDSFARPGEFRIFAGGYDFIGLAAGGGDVFGGRGRAELDLYLFDDMPDTRLSLEASYAYDKHLGDQYGASIKLSIPLGVKNKVSTHGAKDQVVAELDSYGKDLFQPIRRNRSNVSRIRLKNSAPVGGGGAAGVSLSNVCGGASGSLTLNAGLGSSTINQGALVGTIDPSGAATSLNLNLGTMVAPGGQTLAQLLASNPETINTTLTFPASTVDFATDTVRPSSAVAETSSAANGQKITSAIVTISNNECSMIVETEPAGPTLDTVCGGPNNPITLIGPEGLPPLASNSILQGATLESILNFEGTVLRQHTLVIANAVNGSGQTLAQLLASKPNSINTTLTLPGAIFNPETEYSTTAPAVTISELSGCGQSIASAQLTVGDNQCTLQLNLNVGCGSDLRLKNSIRLLGISAAGYKIYSFKYNQSFKPDSDTYVGVMAQDVLKTRPSAVTTMPNGYYAVRYDQLGLRMTKLDAYKHLGLAAVEINQTQSRTDMQYGGAR